METVGIVGLGPRGASLLERLITHIIKTKSQNKLRIILFDKNINFGSGCHSPTLPQDLLTNTIACQMTMYFGPEMEDVGPVYKGPSLYQWACKRMDAPIKPTDYLSRSLLGQYLHDFYLEQLSRLEEHKICFSQIHAEVTDIADRGDHVEIFTETSKHMVSQAILCTGHQANDTVTKDSLDNFLNYQELESIDSTETVGVQGIGLTGNDVISRLTEGRGGAFKKMPSGKLEYIRSGEEPNIYLFSRTGMFFSGRAYNNDPDYIYSPALFTKEAITQKRREKGQLDFEDDVLPLLEAELKHAFSTLSHNEHLNLDTFFNPEKLLNTENARGFKESFLGRLRWDIEECLKGKMCSPHKFCQDAIRDLRDQLRAAIDFEGLTGASHNRFLSHWQPKLLKISVGPPYSRLMELEALMAAGVCHVDVARLPRIEQHGSGYRLTCHYDNETVSVDVDHIVRARTPSMTLCDTPNALTGNLLRRFSRFLISGVQHGGLSVDEDNRVIRSNGAVCQRIRALGIPTEGSKYFTLVLGRPGMVSTFLADSNSLAKSVMTACLDQSIDNPMAVACS